MPSFKQKKLLKDKDSNILINKISAMRRYHAFSLVKSVEYMTFHALTQAKCVMGQLPSPTNRMHTQLVNDFRPELENMESIISRGYYCNKFKTDFEYATMTYDPYLLSIKYNNSK